VEQLSGWPSTALRGAYFVLTRIWKRGRAGRRRRRVDLSGWSI